MSDSRLEAYARLLVDRSINPQPGWQVVVDTTPLARPLVEAVYEELARRGAYAVGRLSLESADSRWLRNAPAEVVSKAASITSAIWQQADAFMFIDAPENTFAGSDIPTERLMMRSRATSHLRKRLLDDDIPWVICQWPTPALAQGARMSLDAYMDFVLGCCLLDWDEMGRKMAHVKERFDRAKTVRIVGDGTDLKLSLAGRAGLIDDGRKNMPGGEVFYSPVEDSAEGFISYREFPGCFMGQEAEGVRLLFKDGVVVDASADRNEAFLIKTLDVDPGARRLGELGIGCNPMVTQHMRNVLFDEKMDGTVHLAIGSGFKFLGGTNESAVHWDMVKDLRAGGALYCDGELVQKDGKWV